MAYAQAELPDIILCDVIPELDGQGVIWELCAHVFEKLGVEGCNAASLKALETFSASSSR